VLAVHLLQAALVHIDTLLVRRVLSEPARKERLADEDRGGTALFRSNLRPYGSLELDRTVTSTSTWWPQPGERPRAVPETPRRTPPKRKAR